MLKILLKALIILMVLGGVYACASKPKDKIASIDEASGISYCKNSDTLLVVADEGDIYEIKKGGKILSKHHLGDFDLEGVVCQENDAIVAVEDGKILQVDRKNFRFKKVKISGKDFKLGKNSGIEGIAKIDNNRFILTIQSKKKKGAKFLDLELKNGRAEVKNIIDSGIIDSAGAEFSDGKLFVVSDKKDKLYIFDLKNKKILKKIKLPKFAQEGVTFDDKNIYFADDDGGVFKYKKSKFLE
jgi:uncharacterized protein YjiK